MTPCPGCDDPEGEAACRLKRAGFAAEPWLPNGFELGAQWYSFDNGCTWTRNPEAREIRPRSGTMTVTKIDRERGEVTIKAGA